MIQSFLFEPRFFGDGHFDSSECHVVRVLLSDLSPFLCISSRKHWFLANIFMLCMARACGICIVEAEKWMPASLCLSISVCVCVCFIANSIEISSFNRSSRLYKNSRQSQTHKHAHERNETRSHTHKESHKCRMRYGQKEWKEHLNHVNEFPLCMSPLWLRGHTLELCTHKSVVVPGCICYYTYITISGCIEYVCCSLDSRLRA